MKLLIVSNMAHYYRDGQLVGHGSTATEISYLAQLFEQVIHIGCLHPGPAPMSFLPYKTNNIYFVPQEPTGGTRFRDKLRIVEHAPGYAKTILRELPGVDMVHVRAPANIPLIAIVLLAFARTPHLRWVKYAGNWQPTRREAWSSRFQRWWLKKGLHRGFVTVNGEWPGQPAHVRSFINPCLTDEELQAAARIAGSKTLSRPLRLLFVGAVNEAKGVGRALQIVQRLHQKGIPLTFDIIGDGTASDTFARRAQELGIGHYVRFHGALPRAALNDYYAQAHIMLLPTGGEGWPKVLSEGMAYGVVPVSGNVSSIPQYLERFQVGKALDPYDVGAFTQAIIMYYSHPDIWKQESLNGLALAAQFTYSHYLQDVRDLLGLTD